MSVKNPLISIIVPNYNHENYLIKRLESIFNQTYQNFEVILLDDCSTDKSREILSSYSENLKVSYCVFNKINSGNTFIQWNKGIALAKGEYIWIAESDDFCESNFLEELIKPMQEDEDIVLAYCQSNRVNETNMVIGNWLDQTDDLNNELFLKNFVIEGNIFIEKFHIYRNVIPNASGVVFRKDRVDHLGYLDTDPILKFCGDWLFYFKLIVNKKIAYIPDLLNNFRQHSQSVVATAVRRGNHISFINVNLKARIKMMNYLSNERPNNIDAIRKINKSISENFKYEKAFIFIRNNKQVKGSLILLSLFNLFIKKNNIRRKMKMKFSVFFKSIRSNNF